jgi:hypothetical protein
MRRELVPRGAVFGVECRPGCRDMPLYAVMCRSLERKSLIFLGLGFFFASQLRWRSASRAKLAREPEGRRFESLPARQFSLLLFADSTSERSESSNPSRRAIHYEHFRTLWRRHLPDWWNFG